MAQQLFVCRLLPIRPELLEGPRTEEEALVLREHKRYVGDLADRGVVLLSGRTVNADNSAFGLMILAVASSAEARALVAEDPAVANRIMRAEIYPFKLVTPIASTVAG